MTNGNKFKQILTGGGWYDRVEIKNHIRDSSPEKGSLRISSHLILTKLHSSHRTYYHIDELCYPLLLSYWQNLLTSLVIILTNFIIIFCYHTDKLCWQFLLSYWQTLLTSLVIILTNFDILSCYHNDKICWHLL